MALSRADVVRAAIALLDDGGLAGLTLRRLATELGVSAPTLYWHIKHKRELLDLMAVELAAAHGRSGSPRRGQPWWDWLAEQARQQWRALLAHRDAALVLAGNRPTEAQLPLIDETLGTLVTVGFPPREAMEHLFAVGHYVIGCAVEYQAEAARPAMSAETSLGVSTETPPGMAGRAHRRVGRIDADGAVGRIDADRLPYLAAAADRQLDPERSFEHGLALLIAGLRARQHELALCTPPPGEPGGPALICADERGDR